MRVQDVTGNVPALDIGLDDRIIAEPKMHHRPASGPRPRPAGVVLSRGTPVQSSSSETRLRVERDITDEIVLL